jgi:hypothetical protein
MERRTLVGIAFILALGSGPLVPGSAALAQEPPAPAPQPRAPTQEKEKEAATERQAAERARALEQERREREAAQPVNIRIELTIRDQRGSGAPDTKTVSVVTADRSVGRIRTGGNVRPEKFGVQEVRLNVDVRAIIVRENQIRLNLTVEYRPSDTETSPSNAISETIECVTQSGQPLVVSKSADPTGDRSVTVEVKATVLK